ncbi:MAG TPA: hypothetical protein PK127_07755 [Clostridiales bacterium]|nr:hypothetical protein [Clostridiales bacterium]HPV02352.1 hypothetical protein [Clostridiales bacterium]
MTSKKALAAVLLILAALVTFCSLPVCASIDEAVSIPVNGPVTDNLPKYDTVKYYKVELPSPGRVTLG